MTLNGLELLALEEALPDVVLGEHWDVRPRKDLAFLNRE
jgi:hypothetical protein